jgi:ProP effector
MQDMPNTDQEPMPETAATPTGTAAPATPTAPASEAKPKRATREVNPVLEKLFELHPNLFGAKFLPLKLGIFHDLLTRYPDAFKKDELKLAMGQHARSTRYLECVAAGLARHDLDGVAVEPVAPEHVHHAILEVFRRRQARSKEDLRPRLTVLLKQAIENSGLALDDYAALVRVQDEATNALLDDAMAELKAEAAKREALMTTFKASGKTEAEFADMYGMNLKLVSSVLARVRADEAVQAKLEA